MIKRWLLIVCLMSPVCLYAQVQAEYNIKGDEAMARNDYRDAQMWYAEGLISCDAYSIQQLTAIWLQQEDMRPAMHSLMTRCFSCLNTKATASDTTAMVSLVTYYQEGIGIPKNEELVVHWNGQLEQLRHPAPAVIQPEVVPFTPREPMKFFAGYAFSIESPYGVTIGGMWKRAGWYVRFKTNMSFRDYAYECNDNSVIIDAPSNVSTRYESEKGNKTNSYAGTGGVVAMLTPWLYTSVGLGYGERVLLCPFVLTKYTGGEQEVWCYNIDSSHKGLAAECDVMVRLGRFYVSAGANTINFDYVDLNAGLGYFF